MFPTFLKRFWGMKPTLVATVTGISMVGAILGGIAIGFLSDRFGRRKTMITAIMCAIAVIPLWADHLALAPSVASLIYGLAGGVVAAEVGDLVKVVERNEARQREHPADQSGQPGPR